MKIIQRFILTISGIIFFHFLSYGQEIYFQNFTAKNGLPSVQVYNIYQDINGYLWFATDRGICRYNGYDFESFGIENGLTSNTVFKFYPQDNGDIWCSTMNNRFFIFNTKDYLFREYQYNDTLAKYAKDAINDDLFIDQNGTVHIAFINTISVLSIDAQGKLIDSGYLDDNDELSIVMENFPGGKTFTYIKGENKINSISRNVISQSEIKTDHTTYHKSAYRKNNTLLADMKQVYIFQNGKLAHKINNGSPPIGVGFFDDQHIWISTISRGISIYDMNGKLVNNYLNGKSVSFMMKDHEGGCWISTLTSGVFYTKNFLCKQIVLDTNPVINCLTFDSLRGLIVGLYNGNAYRLNNNGEANLIHQSTIKMPSLIQYYASLNGTLSFLDGRTMIKNKKSHLFDNVFVYKFSDESSSIPLFTGTNLFYSLKNNRINIYPFNQRIYDVCPAENGALLATMNGVYQYDTTLRTAIKLHPKLINQRVTDIDRFKQNVILVASHNNGLYILKGDSVWSIKKETGLCSNLINEVYVQNDSTFWVCTNSGLNRIKLNEKNEILINTITTSDGLQDNDVIDIEVIDSTVWAGTRSGLSYFPLSIFKSDTICTNYYLKILNLRVNGEAKLDLTSLDYLQNRLQIDFHAISFKSNANIEYRYKMKGLEKEWNHTKTKRVIYESLPPGVYSFELQVGLDKQWSEAIKPIKINISPPFYDLLWFRILVGFFLIGLVSLFFRIKILTYNRDITREILRQLLKRLKRKSHYLIIRDQGRDIKIRSSSILFVKASGNYIEIHTENGAHVTRDKISNFIQLVPDPIEYLRVHRSYVVRIDKVRQKSIKTVTVADVVIDVGHTYLKVLSNIKF